MIDGEIIIISDCRFVKSNTKLKVKQNQFIDWFFYKNEQYFQSEEMTQVKKIDFVDIFFEL